MPSRAFHNNQSFSERFPDNGALRAMMDRNHQRSLPFLSTNKFIERPRVFINGIPLQASDPHRNLISGEFRRSPNLESETHRPNFNEVPDPRFQSWLEHPHMPNIQNRHQMQNEHFPLPFQPRVFDPFNNPARLSQQHAGDRPWSQRPGQSQSNLRDLIKFDAIYPSIQDVHVRRPVSDAYEQPYIQQSEDAQETLRDAEIKSEIKPPQQMQEHFPTLQIKFPKALSAQIVTKPFGPDTTKEGRSFQNSLNFNPEKDRRIIPNTLIGSQFPERQIILKRINHNNPIHERSAIQNSARIKPAWQTNDNQNGPSQKIMDNWRRASYPENRFHSQAAPLAILSDKIIHSSINVFPEDSSQGFPYIPGAPGQHDPQFLRPIDYSRRPQHPVSNEDRRLGMPLVEFPSKQIPQVQLAQMPFPPQFNQFLSRPLRFHLSHPIQTWLSKPIKPSKSKKLATRRNGSLIKSDKQKQNKKAPKKAIMKKNPVFQSQEEKFTARFNPETSRLLPANAFGPQQIRKNNQLSQPSEASSLGLESGLLNQKLLEDFGTSKRLAIDASPNNKFTFLQVFVNKQDSDPTVGSKPSERGPPSSAPELEQRDRRFRYPQRPQLQADRYSYPQLPMNIPQSYDTLILPRRDEFHARKDGKLQRDDRMKDDLERFEYRRYDI